MKKFFNSIAIDIDEPFGKAVVGIMALAVVFGVAVSIVKAPGSEDCSEKVQEQQRLFFQPHSDLKQPAP
jgi:hypothetical protein